MLFGVLSCATAQAQGSSQNNYSRLIRDALAEYELGNWGEARVLFEKAHAIKPSARTWRALGLTSFELKHYADAIKELETALESDVKPLTSQQRESAERVLSRAQEYVAKYELSVPEGVTQVNVDGEPVDISSDGTILLDPGKHTLQIQPPGEEPMQRRVVAEVGAREQLSFELEPEPSSEAEAAAPQTAQAGGVDLTTDTDPASRDRQDGLLWTWFAAGTAVGLGAATLTFGLLTNSKKDEYDSLRNSCPSCTTQLEDIRSTGRTYQTVFNVGLALTGVAAAGAITLFLIETSDSGERAPSEVAVGVGPGSLTLRGAF